MSINARIARAEAAAASLGSAKFRPMLADLEDNQIAVLLSSAPIDDFIVGVDAEREAILRGLWADAHAIAGTLPAATRSTIERDLRGMGYLPAGVT